MDWPTILHVDWGDYLPALGSAAIVAFKYTVVGFIGAMIVGLATALMRISPMMPLRALGRLYTELFRNMPFVTQIFIIYFGLGSVGIRIDVFSAGCLSLSLCYGAYLAEIFRSALQGVAPMQWEVGQAVGLSRSRTFVYVIMPQATRLALGGTSTMLVDCVKGTSLMVTIGGAELMSVAQRIVADTFRAMEVYVVVGLLYVVLTYPLSYFAGRIEDRLRRGLPILPTRRRFLKLALQRSRSFDPARLRSGADHDVERRDVRV